MGEIVLRERLAEAGLLASGTNSAGSTTGAAGSATGSAAPATGSGAAAPSSAAGSVSFAFAVESAGVSSEENGKGVYPPAQRVLREAGYDIPNRRAHRVTDAELSESGLILAMTSGHARELRKRCLAAGVPVERIHLWREFDGSGLSPAPAGCFGSGGVLANDAGASGYSNFYSYGDAALDVPDPWFGGYDEFVATLDVVERGATGIVEILTAE